MAKPKKADVSRITVYIRKDLKEKLDQTLGREYGAQSETFQNLLSEWLERKEGEELLSIHLSKETADALREILTHTDMGVQNTIMRLIMNEARTYTEGGGGRQQTKKVLELQEEILRILKEKHEPTI